MRKPVIAIFDVGKTNKKLLLFDESYSVVFEKSENLPETKDDDGFPCENLKLLSEFVLQSFDEVLSDERFDVRAVNFSGYGASFVLIDIDGQPVSPLYNYLKPYPELLLEQFYNTYRGRETFSSLTASPVLGSLNSGMQLYRLKYENPKLFTRVRYALHLPQYLSYLVSGRAFSEITSIGCHTNLWNFRENKYHKWVDVENIKAKLPPLARATQISEIDYKGSSLRVGTGLHDSSAALIPYLRMIREPFVLISTGTWAISLNAFNKTSLSLEELQRDCLCYLTYEGKSVKASRFFAGPEYEENVGRVSSHFNVDLKFFNQLNFNADLALATEALIRSNGSRAFANSELSSFSNAEAAYYYLMHELVSKQVQSTGLILKGSKVSKIIVDGGFSKNRVFMNMVARRFEHDVYAAAMSQGTALGAAMAVHEGWNQNAIPDSLIELKYYPAKKASVLQ